VKPEVQGLEGRQLLSGAPGAGIGAFARGFEGGPANDIAVYRPSNGTWYIAEAATGFNTKSPLDVQLGTQGDIPIFNSDFFGSGHDDFAVFRPSNGTWYVKDPSTGQKMIAQWGTQGDVPLASSDFFGDGRADFAVFRPSNGTWYIKDPLNNQTLSVQWGMRGDEPLANVDFDGDGRADIAVFDPSSETWHILTSSSNYNPLYQIQRQWGATSDEAIGAPAAPDPIFILNRDAGAQYRSFQGDPLFASDGPSPNDIAQGQAYDCTVLARLHAVAEKDPGRIRQSIFDMGNGLYGVDLQPYGQDQCVVVNADLPTDSYGGLQWAHLGHQNSLLVALIEKAWTFAKPVPANVYETAVGTDAMIDGAGYGTLWDAMRFTSSTVNTPTNSKPPWRPAKPWWLAPTRSSRRAASSPPTTAMTSSPSTTSGRVTSWRRGRSSSTTPGGTLSRLPGVTSCRTWPTRCRQKSERRSGKPAEWAAWPEPGAHAPKRHTATPLRGLKTAVRIAS